MCGIAGFISLHSSGIDDVQVIQAMANSMSHRGPDDAGFELMSYGNDNGLIAFGHRRLSIIDLSPQGHQPMWNQDRTLCVTFNGEIYNYVEIRVELIQLGYQFRTRSDTEVILSAFEEWGAKSFSKFNGMWAIAIYDKKARKIVLSRDRFGKKPLYYFRTSTEFIFASEIKALLKHPKVVKKPNYEKIFRYISTNYRYVDIDEFSYFKDIVQVPKSCIVEVDEKLNLNKYTYWKLDDNISARNIPFRQAVNEFRDLLIDAVRIRLRSDVPVGCFLSGGLDSTSITCIAYKVLQQQIVTFSGITGEEKGIYDESDYIDSVINHTHANYHYVQPDPSDLLETIDQMLAFHDEPICTVTWYTLYLIAKKIKIESIPVMLNGHAGDEILAGYWDYYHYFFHDLEKLGNMDVLRNEITWWHNNHKRDMNEIERYRNYILSLEKNETNEMTRFPDYSDCFIDDIVKQYKRVVQLPIMQTTSWLSRRMYADLFFEGVPAILRSEDRNTMSQSIESRSPFLDFRLVEYCFSLPNEFKIKNGVGKWILREAMKGILPEDVRTRKDKAGFIAPADEWFRTINKEHIYRLIKSDEFSNRGLFNVSKILDVFEEHLRKGKNHYMFLWQLINLELWFRRFF